MGLFYLYLYHYAKKICLIDSRQQLNALIPTDRNLKVTCGVNSWRKNKVVKAILKQSVAISKAARLHQFCPQV
jgi:hypothetical protein